MMSPRSALFVLFAILSVSACSAPATSSSANPAVSSTVPNAAPSVVPPVGVTPVTPSVPPVTQPPSVTPPVTPNPSVGALPGSATPPAAQSCTRECVSDCAGAGGSVVAGTCAPGLSCCETSADTTDGASETNGAPSSETSAGSPPEDTSGDPSSEPAPGGAEFDYASIVENTSADCEVGELAASDELPTIEKLPDPFTKLDGTRLTKKSEWRCRRQEIRKQAEKYVYGERPVPDLVSGTVTDTKISVHVEALGKSIDFTADVVLPKTGQAPYPAIINVGAKGGFGGISLGESRITDQGVAVIYYNHYELGKEGTAEQSRGKPNPGKFYDIYGGTHSAGLLQAWSWGASRLIDVIQQSDGSVLDVANLGVTGCSRNGKGAFAIGLFDDRVALTIPQETSTAGVPVYRLVDILNTERTDHNYFGLNWFSDNFEPFVYDNGVSKAVKLPIDTHELVASIAPRGLLVLDNPHQTQMSAPAGHLATAAGAEVYKALGVADHVSYHSSVSDMAHCSYKNEYTDLLERNISRFLKHEDAKTGDFIVGQGGDGKLADWKQWETPTLSD